MRYFCWLALRNLRRNFKRNVATGSAIAFGFAGILLLAGYTYRVKNYLRVYTVFVVHTGHLAIFADNGFEKFPYSPERYSLSPDDQKLIEPALRSEPGVRLYERQLRGQGLVGNGCTSLPFSAQGYEPAIDHVLHGYSEVKRWMPQLQFFLAGRGMWNFPDSLNPILLSKGLSLALGKTHVHDELAEVPVKMVDCADKDVKQQFQRDANVQLLSNAWQGGLSAVDGEVVGRFSTGIQESDNSAIIMDLSLMQRLYNTDHVSQFAVWLRYPARLTEVEAHLKRKFEAAGKHYEFFHWDDERISPFYAGTVQFLDTMVSVVSLILASVITLSVLNSTTMTILERSQEIGMYRSMGFRRSHIRILYLLESFWLSLFSLIAGALLAYLVATSVNSSGYIYYPPGIAGGLNLMLILHWASSLNTGFLIIGLVLIATFLAVSNRLKLRPADLVGGTLR